MYRGFGTQPHCDTIQDNIQKAIKKVTKEEVIIFATSRTDKGVHALVQYASFELKCVIPCANLLIALNAVVSKGIRIDKISENTNLINPRYDCISKTYKYIITSKDDLFKRKYNYFYSKKLDIVEMNKGAEYFVGTKNFSSVCASNANVESKVRTINFLKVYSEEDQTIIEINADGFLYNMVRIIVGNLIQVGIKAIQPEHIEEILSSKDRMKSFSTVPGNGLYLKEIFIKGINI
jgi:tRNA pseudouridine38-40 synthase